MPPTLEQKFHGAMIQLYDRAASECNYRPTRFLQMVNERGGLLAAKELLHAPTPAEGLTTLWELDRLDLSLEALVCQDPWNTLFTEDELRIAKKRLKDFGYKG